MIPSSTKPMSTPMQCLVWNQRNWACSNGNHLRNIGVATMRLARQRKPTAFTRMKCLQNCSGKDEIYPLTTVEIAETQLADASLKHLFKRNAVIDQGLEIKLIENTACVCKDGWLVIPKPLQVRAVKWYHHYLQHRGHWLCRYPQCQNLIYDSGSEFKLHFE